MAERRVYNERFLYADPLATSSLSRATRHRFIKKARLDQETVSEENPPSCDIDAEQYAEEIESSTLMQIPVEQADYASELPDFEYLELPDEPSLPGEMPHVHSGVDDEVRLDEAEDTEFQTDGNIDATVQDEHIEEQLFPGCPLTQTSSSLLVMKFRLRHNLTQEALADLLKLIKLHCPAPNRCLSSVYKFDKKFALLKCTIEFHSYCKTCLQELSNQHIGCPNPNCAQQASASAKNPQFIGIPIEQQLKSILESESS